MPRRMVPAADVVLARSSADRHGMNKENHESDTRVPAHESPASEHSESESVRREIGGPRGPEPTRYGDWERKGRCIDF